VPDFLDLDSDNDLILDTIESSHPDIDLDGLVDQLNGFNNSLQSDGQLIGQGPAIANLLMNDVGLMEGAGLMPLDTDADGVADFRDVDSDNDSITDILESSTTAQDLDGDGRVDEMRDDNGNGVDDQYEAAPTQALDTDSDGARDAVDVDADADGVSDVLENGGVDADGDGRLDNIVDINADGVDDTIAMFVLAPQDTDADGFPDYRDVDSKLAREWH